MARNLEWKARLPNFDDALQTAAALATAGPEHLEQLDTYFRVSSGRLKLREIRSAAGERAELIGYRRADETAFKTSRYELLDVPDAARWREMFATLLGELVQVRKQRTVYFHRNVRIHLDRVAGLGDFLEFEAVLAPDDDELAAHTLLDRLRTAFDLRDEDGIAYGYAEIISRL